MDTKKVIVILLILIIVGIIVYDWKTRISNTLIVTPTPSNKPSQIPTPTTTPIISPIPTYKPSQIPTPTPTPIISPTPSHKPSQIPTPTSTPIISPTPSHKPSQIPTPTSTPIISPTPTSKPIQTSTITPEFYTNTSDHFYSFYNGNYIQNISFSNPVKVETFPIIDLPSLFGEKKYLALSGEYSYNFDNYGIPTTTPPLTYDKSLCSGINCRTCTYSNNKIECGCTDTKDESSRCTSTGIKNQVWIVYKNPLYNRPPEFINISILPLFSDTLKKVILPYTLGGFETVVLNTKSPTNLSSLEITYTKSGDYIPFFKITSDQYSTLIVGEGAEISEGKAIIEFMNRSISNNLYITVNGIGLYNTITFTGFKFL